jgi:hypothetical protein
VKNHKIADNSETTEAREKSTYLECLELQKFFGACLTKFENSQILLTKISSRFLVTNKLFRG